MIYTEEVLKNCLVKLLFIGLLVSTAFAYSGGSGTESDPYQIAAVSDWNDLMNTVSDWNKHFIMTADVNLQGVALTPVGIDYVVGFTGVFDGNSHIIRNVYINNPTGHFIGLFGTIIDGQVRNLGVENVNIVNVNISDYSCVGGLVGWNYGYTGTISNCYVTGSVCGDDMAGGLAGENNGFITDCFATGDVNGITDVGGLVGGNTGTIETCYATGSVNGSNYVGGLAGSQYQGSETIIASYATGTVTGNTCVGGLVGWNSYSAINGCYSVGQVIGDTDVGGLVGYSYNGTIDASFWDVNTSGQPTSAGGTGKTTVEMKTLSTFTSAGWDFVSETANGYLDTWQMCVDGLYYPKLSWQFPLGDFVCPDGVDFYDFAVFAGQWLLEKLSYDVASGKGDGIVNFLDWAVFANNWQGDMAQLSEFTSQWLKSSAYNADIAPEPDGDGVVNFIDFALFAENWLQNCGPYVRQLNVQPCDMNDSLLTLDSNGTRFSIIVQGNNLYFEDMIEANCCKDEIRLDMSVEGNKINIYEIEITTNPCYCLCDFPTTALLGPFESGDYIVEVFDVGGNSLGTVEVSIPSQ